MISSYINMEIHQIQQEQTREKVLYDNLSPTNINCHSRTIEQK